MRRFRVEALLLLLAAASCSGPNANRAAEHGKQGETANVVSAPSQAGNATQPGASGNVLPAAPAREAQPFPTRRDGRPLPDDVLRILHAAERCLARAGREDDGFDHWESGCGRVSQQLNELRRRYAGDEEIISILAGYI